jgi:hypothetical protein
MVLVPILLVPLLLLLGLLKKFRSWAGRISRLASVFGSVASEGVEPIVSPRTIVVVGALRVKLGKFRVVLDTEEGKGCKPESSDPGF